MTVHNVLPHDRHTRLNHLLYMLIYRVPHKLVVHTESMKHTLTKRFEVSASRIVVMYHGTDAVPDEPQRVRAVHGVLHILLFGVLSPYKGTDLLLRALQLCPDLSVHVVIAGECIRPDYADEVAELIAGVGRHHSVEWVRGFVPEDKVRDYFESADVVVLPYRHIDQSGVLFTAFRFGTPVIATDVGAFRESLPDFAGLICTDATPEAIAATLVEFAERQDEFQRERIKQHGRTLAWPRTVRPLLEAYRQAAFSS